MRALPAVRNYALLVFAIVLAGGVLLRPGQPRRADQAQPVQLAQR